MVKVKAKKCLGQNFLHDQNVLRSIVEAGEIKAEDTVVEIGPGEGALTAELVKRAGKLLAIEKDRDLIPFLHLDFKSFKNFELIQGDALEWAPPSESYKVIANIPYYITSPLLNHFLKEQFMRGNPPELLVLMVQKEVAEKILAKDGKHSLLSLEVQLFADVEMVCKVPASAFRPRPKVDSAVIKIRVLPKARVEGDLKKLFWLFHVSFAQKRKKLSNNLAAVFRKKSTEMMALLQENKINPDIRAEALNFDEWQRLFTALYSVLPS